MDEHTDQTRIHNSQFITWGLEREWWEQVPDDKAVMYGLKVRRPAEDAYLGEPIIPLRIELEPDIVNPADFGGGLIVLGTMKPAVLAQALSIGMTHLTQQRLLNCESFYDRNGHDEPSGE